MKILKSILSIILIAFIFSCSKDDDAILPTIQEPAKITNIYIGGSQKIAGKERATIWKNGVAELLTTDASNASRVNSIYVYNDNVYAVGFEIFPTEIRATLWKNGANITLEYGFSEAYSIAGFKDNIYIAGQFYRNATLWTNGSGNFVDTNLSSIDPSFAKSIFLTNDVATVTGVSIVGKVGNNAWTYINNNNNLLTNTSTAESVYVRGNDVFVTINNEFLDIKTASLQKNGILQNTIASNTAMYSVYGDEQNIYAVGVINPNTVNARATIWENYIPKQLSQLYSQANSVFVADKNVYVAGFEYDSNTAHYKATLWINGKVQTISTEDCQTKSVFVTVK
jgi:hypothetical protein